MVDIETVARIVVEAAAQVIMPRWRNLDAGDVESKSAPGDMVTIADREMEALLARRLTGLLPGSVAIGEESIHADVRLARAFSSDAPLWVIDPIDGTSAFVRGSDEFAVMVALVVAREPVAGWLHAPAQGAFHLGEKGSGVMRDIRGNRQFLPRPAAPADRMQLVGLLGRKAMPHARREKIKSQERHFRALQGVACAGIDYPRLLAGEVHFAIYNKSEPWDHLPGLALAREQGLVYAKHDGSDYFPGDNAGGLLIAPDWVRLDEIRRLLLQ